MGNCESKKYDTVISCIKYKDNYYALGNEYVCRSAKHNKHDVNEYYLDDTSTLMTAINWINNGRQIYFTKYDSCGSESISCLDIPPIEEKYGNNTKSVVPENYFKGEISKVGDYTHYISYSKYYPDIFSFNEHEETEFENCMTRNIGYGSDPRALFAFTVIACIGVLICGVIAFIKFSNKKRDTPSSNSNQTSTPSSNSNRTSTPSSNSNRTTNISQTCASNTVLPELSRDSSENSKELCGICLDNDPNVVLEPCKHNSICSSCMLKDITVCPFCRSTITSYTVNM